MKIIPTKFKEVVIVEPDVFADQRGFFMETYNEKRYNDHGILSAFVQDNISLSSKGTLRGLHFQITKPQAKLVSAITGAIFDVAVDIRTGSPTFGEWVGAILDENNKQQLLVPEGFAHGFCVISETAHVLYKCSNLYDRNDEGGILWSDPDIGINWPIDPPVLSDRDKNNRFLKDISAEQLYSPM